jgi:drug/metabolite transporter (DMT)-like permease
MVSVCFITDKGERVSASAQPGQRLLEVGQAAGMPLEGTCEGQMACSTCHVIVSPDWFDKLPSAHADEEDMLDLAAGVARTSASNAGLIISFAIVMTPVLESIASRHWLPAPYFVATTVAVVGVGLLVSSHGLHRPNVGDVLMLAASFGRATAVTSSGHMTKGYDYDAMFYTFIQCSVGAVLLTVISVPQDIQALGRLTLTQWGGLLYLGIFCSVIGLMLQLWAVRATSASRASLLLGTEPLFAVAVSVVIGHESMTTLGILGGVLIVAATYAAQGTEIRHRLGSQHHSLT